MNDNFIWALIFICGVTSVVMFAWILRLASQSKGAIREDVADRYEKLRQIYLEIHKRSQRIDVLIIDRMRQLTTRGSEAHSMLRQIMTKISHRLEDVDRLRASGAVEDLLKAQTILLSPIDNTGNTYDSLVFADTILTLQPDQFSFALDMMCNFVEKDLDRPLDAPSPIPTNISVAPSAHRERRFTIRGFFKLLSGD